MFGGKKTLETKQKCPMKTKLKNYLENKNFKRALLLKNQPTLK